MPEELNCITRFRNNLSDIIPELEPYRRKDWYLVKWLEEHNYDLKKAEYAFRMAFKWNLDFDLSSVLNEDFSDMKKMFPYDQDGISKDGLPVLLVPFGKWDIRSVVEKGQKDRFLRYVFQITEQNVLYLNETVKKTKGNIQHVIIIFDLKGYSFSQLMHRPTIQTICEWTKRSEEQYPRQLKNFYVINAPKVLPVLYNLLKPFMSAYTVSCVKIFDSTAKHWEKTLLQEINEDQIGIQYGGTKRYSFGCM